MSVTRRGFEIYTLKIPENQRDIFWNVQMRLNCENQCLTRDRIYDHHIINQTMNIVLILEFDVSRRTLARCTCRGGLSAKISSFT